MEFTPEQTLEFVRLILKREEEHERSDIGTVFDKPISKAGLEALKILFPHGVQG